MQRRNALGWILNISHLSIHERSLLVVAILLLSGAIMHAGPVPSLDKKVVEYGFEDGTEGWHQTSYEGAQAVKDVAVTHAIRYEGRQALRIQLDLRAQHESLGNGEVFVDVFEGESEEDRIPMDLEGREISMYVYCPPGMVGDPSSPNGFQVFVKDEKWRSEYSRWVDVEPGKWLRLTLTPSREEPEGGYKSNVFNPQRIYLVGLKVGSGGQSLAEYRGPIYLDSVWYVVKE